MKTSEALTWKDKVKILKGKQPSAKSKGPPVVVEISNGEDSEPVKSKNPVRRSRKRKATHGDDSDDTSSIEQTVHPKRVRRNLHPRPNVSQDDSQLRQSSRERSHSLSSAGDSDSSSEDGPAPSQVQGKKQSLPAGTDALVAMFSQMIGALPPDYLQNMMQNQLLAGQPQASGSSKGASKQAKESGKGKGRK